MVFCLIHDSACVNHLDHLIHLRKFWGHQDTEMVIKKIEKLHKQKHGNQHIRIVLKLVKANTYCAHQYAQHDPSLDNEESES